MPALRFLLLLLIVMFIKTCYAQVKTTRKETKEYYPTGELKRLVITKTKKESDIGLFNMYIRTSIKITELYPWGTVKSQEKTVDKIGEAGGPCYHLLVTRKEYTEKGKICYYYKSRCDKRKLFYKVYNNDGKRLNKTTFKRNRWE